MKTRKLGNIDVSAIGMGCMGFSTAYGKIPEEKESIRLMREAHELGCTLYDTAEIYATYRNEELVGKALRPIRNEIVLCTKFSPAALPGEENIEEGKLSRNGVRYAVEHSLKRLQADHIDIYYAHRVPAEVDPEELAEWFGELIKEGKILAWGVSEATADQIRKAHAVTPIAAVQSEYSMMARQWEKDVIPLCGELGIGFVAYSPMAGGLLSGKYNANEKYEGDDIRRVISRYKPENVEANQPVIDLVKKYAAEKGCTPAQISLAWDMHRDYIVPIPGMRSDARIVENLGAADVVLTDEEYRTLTEALDSLTVYGNRTDEQIAKLGKLRTEMFGSSGVHSKFE
ncbi:MAG: aldo/keto reductase [Pseudoflavonifractor sp.]|nr:aldo/keto reductase [Pseudoflavonifractor sp.]